MEERKTDHVKIWFGRDGEGAVLCILKIIIERGGGGNLARKYFD